MLYLRGRAALSPFRLEKRIVAARSKVASLATLHAEEVYFVDVEQRLEATERAVLSRLLGEEDAGPQPIGDMLLVVLRFGSFLLWVCLVFVFVCFCWLFFVFRVVRG